MHRNREPQSIDFRHEAFAERTALLRRLHAQRWRRAGRNGSTSGSEQSITVPRRLPPLRLFGAGGGPRAWLCLIRQARVLRGTGLFDAEWYLLRYPDIALDGAHPLWHWLAMGWREGREPNPLFEPKWYLQQYRDVAEAGINPLLHYLEHGATEGRRPGPLFDPGWYLASYPEVAAAGKNPLVHFLQRGMEDGCEPGPDFDRTWYLRHCPEAAHAGIPPLWHYLLVGRSEGRSATPPGQIRRPAPPREIVDSGSRQATALRMTPEQAARARTAVETTDIGRFSVIMPTWNRHKVIDRAIDSVLAQSYTDRELIVCDDGSTDGTGEHLRRRYAKELADGRMRYLELPHGGVCAARNAGLREAKGRWIAWLDSDNAWHPDYLLMTAAGYARDPGRRAAYACVHVHDEAQGREFIRCLPFDRHRLLARNTIDLNVFSHHRELYERLGGFDESLKRLVDWDLILRYTQRHEPLFIPYTLCNSHVSRRLQNITLTEPLRANERVIRRKFAGAAISATTSTARAASAKTQDSRQVAPPFRDFSDYERLSIFLLELTAPFQEEARRVIGHMRAVHRYLGARHASLPESALVSVILYDDGNSAGTEAAIRSVLAQSYRNLELILVGGDGAAQAAERLNDARIRYLRTDGDSPAAARNLALAQASGDFVAWLDGHHTMAQDFLRILVGELLADDEFDMAYCAQGVRTEDAAGSGDGLAAIRYVTFSRALLENRPYIDLGSVLCRRGLTERCGGFDQSMPALANWDFLLRATESASPRAVPCLLSERRATGEETPPELRQQALARVDALLAKEPIARHLPGHKVPGLESMIAPLARVAPAHPRGISVVIPSFECLEYLRLCIDSVQAFTDVPFELIVVDNASSRRVRKYLAGIANGRDVQVIQNDRNYGFTYAVNQGIAQASAGNDIVLLNNDAVVTPGWIGALQKVFEDIPDAGLAVSRQVLLPGTKTMQTHSPACDPAREMDVNLSRHHDNVLAVLPGPAGYVELSFAPFFCVYIPRRTLDEIGPLDFENGPHYRSDLLYCEAVRRIARRRIIYTPHAKVYHFLQQATAALKKQDSDGFQAMFVKNEWTEVRNQS